MIHVVRGRANALAGVLKSTAPHLLWPYCPTSSHSTSIPNPRSNHDAHADSAKAALERENAELREQLAQMKEEISGVTNQEVTIKALKDKLRKYELKYVGRATEAFRFFYDDCPFT